MTDFYEDLYDETSGVDGDATAITGGAIEYSDPSDVIISGGNSPRISLTSISGGGLIFANSKNKNPTTMSLKDILNQLVESVKL